MINRGIQFLFILFMSCFRIQRYYVRNVGLLAFLLAAFTGCDDNKFGGYTKVPLPADFSYRVLKDESDPALGKNQLVVEVNEKLGEGQVATLAETLFKSKDEQPKFYIFYLLPGMKDGSGAWATSNFDPNLTINIIGTTPEEEASENAAVDNVDGEVIGKWREEQYASASYVIFKRDRKTFIRATYKDGSTSDEELTSKKISTGMQYSYKGGGTNGEYFILTGSGDLDFYNSERKKFTTASKL